MKSPCLLVKVDHFVWSPRMVSGIRHLVAGASAERLGSCSATEECALRGLQPGGDGCPSLGVQRVQRIRVQPASWDQDAAPKLADFEAPVW